MAGARRLAGRGRAAAVAETRGVLYVRQKQWAATRPGERLEDGQVRHTQKALDTVQNTVNVNMYCEYCDRYTIFEEAAD